jgi:hypothetical protein
MSKHTNWLCTYVFASAIVAFATPAISQGTGGGAGGESGSSSALPQQQRNPAKCARAFENMLFAKADRHLHIPTKWPWAQSFHQLA